VKDVQNMKVQVQKEEPFQDPFTEVSQETAQETAEIRNETQAKGHS